jgi:hypothetical protein
MFNHAFDRRDFLRASAAAGLWFAGTPLFGRAADQRGPERAKSIVTFWLGGGPSQLETWDPHPGTKIGGPTKAIDCSISGAQIAAEFPQLAEQIHRLSIIRSMVSKEGDHERGAYHLKTGYRPDPTVIHPSIGAIATKELPAPGVDIPQYVAINGTEFPGRGGYFGDQFDPYRIFEAGQTGSNLEAHVEKPRHDRRLEGLKVVSDTFSQGRSKRLEQTLHQHTIDAALRMMRTDQLKAFSLKDEPAAVKTAYGDTPFGKGCLLARRLLETGVRAIEVTQGGFDTHADNFTGHTLRAGILDPALTTFLKELAERDLLDSTVVLVIGEFGRTPKINPLQGRDHWPTGFSCLVGGGGLKSGLVIGATDPTGEKTNPTDPVAVADLYATILHTLGVDYEKEVITPIGRPLKLSDGKKIERLLA